jgi:hypothetical protein
VSLAEDLRDLALLHGASDLRDDPYLALLHVRGELELAAATRAELERTKLALAEARAAERAAIVRAVRAAAEGHDAMGRVGVAPHLRLLADLVEAGDHMGAG